MSNQLPPGPSSSGQHERATHQPSDDTTELDCSESTSWLIRETAGIQRHDVPVMFRGVFANSDIMLSGTALSTFEGPSRELARSPDNAWHWIELACTANIGSCGEAVVHAVSGGRSKEKRISARNDSAQHSLLTPASDGECGVLHGLMLRVAFIDTSGVRHLSRSIPCTQQPGGRDGEALRQDRLCYQVRFDKSVVSKFPCMTVATIERGEHATVEIRMHNPNRALHRKGFWDLGDPGSRKFLALEIWIEGDKEPTILAGLQLFPGTAGMAEELPFNDNGRLIQRFSAASDGKKLEVEMGAERNLNNANSLAWETPHSTTEISSGRASPLVTAALGHAILGVHIPRFWEEFPKAVRCVDNAIVVELVARIEQHSHELQGGESKRFSLEFARSRPTRHSPERAHNFPMHAAALRHPIKPWPRLPEGAVISLCGRALSSTHQFDRLIYEHIVQPTEFMRKREQMDEYGWRNFGDVWADHECHYQSENERPFESHYNNQYDLILGFGLMWIRTGDLAWLELMDDLAKHVVDIDIYSTDRERPEYNNGLFWHTSHYVDAATATHRTWSRCNADPSDPISLGGGPAAEHCYTSGLALHYLLTGDIASRHAVISLANWISRYCDGDSTLAALALTSFRFVRKGRNLDNKKGVGLNRYPINRATGNRVVAMLDAHYLTGEVYWLSECSRVINATFDERDDIGARGLLDTEHQWSYVVFLEAVMRFLGRKESLGEHDRDYWTARRAFVSYCEWMAQNDGPWLDRAEHLEFANDTWFAQDARRLALLAGAIARAARSSIPTLESAAAIIADSVSSGLKASHTTHYARIQALLMWNVGMSTAQANTELVPAASPVPESHARQTSVWPGLGRSFARTIHDFDLKREWRWFKAQIKR